MADNYLERKRRDYEERKKEWIKKKKLHLKPRQKQAKSKFTKMHSSTMKSLMRSFSQVSQKVAARFHLIASRDERPFLAHVILDTNTYSWTFSPTSNIHTAVSQKRGYVHL